MAGATDRLTILSFLAPALMPLYQELGRRVGDALGTGVEVRQGRGYEELVAGEFDFTWVCGLPYVEAVDGLLVALAPVVAPVLSGARYESRPIYFSDVVVPAGSPARTFADLRGKRWAYNEPGSHSGFLAPLGRLAVMGEGTGFFGEWIETGRHQESLRRVAAGAADGSAVDSQVLAVVGDADPSLRAALRVIDTIGPSTVQPFAAGPRAAPAAVDGARAALTAAADDPRCAAAMATAHVERLVPIDDSDYDDIRVKLERVRAAGLWTWPRPAGLRPILEA